MKRLLTDTKWAGVVIALILLAFAVFQGVAAANLHSTALGSIGDSPTRDQLNSLHFSTVLTSASFTIGCFAIAIGLFAVFARRIGVRQPSSVTT